MKLAFALYKYFPFGGLQKDMLTIAQHCLDKGHDVTIYCRQWDGDQPTGITVNVLSVSANSNHKKNTAFQQALSNELMNMLFDCTVAFDRIPGLDFYYAADTCFKAKLVKERPFFLRWLPRYQSFLDTEQQIFLANSATKILALSQPAIDEYRECYGTPEARFTLLPPGIAKDRINPDLKHSLQLHQELNIGKDASILLFIGSGFRTKGLDRAIETLAWVNTHRAAHLVVVGQDNEGHYQKLASKLDVDRQVHFLGGRKDIPELLRSAHLLIHPARRENTGTVLLEAAVAGLPVLTTAACGYSHYIRESGLGIVLTEPFQQTALNESCLLMINSPEKLKSWQQAGCDFARNADIYSMPETAADIICN